MVYPPRADVSDSLLDIKKKDYDWGMDSERLSLTNSWLDKIDTKQ